MTQKKLFDISELYFSQLKNVGNIDTEVSFKGDLRISNEVGIFKNLIQVMFISLTFLILLYIISK